jgi:hypothetical protein
LGGEWPERAKAAALAHERGKGLGDIKLTLLGNICELKADWPKGTPLTAAALATELNAREDWQWGLREGGLSPNSLGMMLKNLGAASDGKQWSPELKTQIRLYSWAELHRVALEYRLPKADLLRVGTVARRVSRQPSNQVAEWEVVAGKRKGGRKARKPLINMGNQREERKSRAAVLG